MPELVPAVLGIGVDLDDDGEVSNVCIVMERCQGCTLKTISGGEISEDDKRRILIAIVEFHLGKLILGLEHSDLHDSNILVLQTLFVIF